MLVASAKVCLFDKYEGQSGGARSKESVEYDALWNRSRIDVDDFVARGSVEEEPSDPEEEATHDSDGGVARLVLALHVVVVD